MASLGESRQVLADLDARCSRGNRPEFAANGSGCFRFQVEAIELGQAAGKKNIDDRPSPGRAGAGAGSTSLGRSNRLDLMNAQAEQTQGAGLDGRAAGEEPMLTPCGPTV